MNCSVVTIDKIFIGCRDRRIFIFHKHSLEYIQTLEVPESVHCMASLNEFGQVAVGMTDGHVLVIASENEG